MPTASSRPWKVRGYEVERLLGRGASSEVWRARVTGTGESVALKRLRLAGDEQRRRARSEAALLSVLDHPNLVRLLDVVVGDDTATLVLDLAEGGSLADLLVARGRLVPGEVVTALAPVAAALAYVHRRGVVHGDVTAANVLFTPGGVALLADLGVARLTGDEADAESTPAYVDPAVAAGGVPAAASDVFMLAAVALHALTGRPAWPGGASEALAAARSGQLDVTPRLAEAGVPAAMTDVLVRALAVDPGERCSAADFALDLRHSGTPVAVELGAGRERGRPAAQQNRLETPLRAGPDVTSPRPAARATYGPRHAAPPEAYGAPPTRAVSRPRPVLPDPRRTRLRSRRRWAVAAAIALGVAVLTAGAAGAWPHRGDDDRAARTSAVAALPASSDAATSRPAPSRPTTSSASASSASARSRALPSRPATANPSPGPSGTTAPSRSRSPASIWTARLRALDELRARAYATGDADLLRRVYLPGPLLRADAIQLRRLVPPGCGLRGAATRFGQVRVRVSGTARAVLTARASIPVSVLRCRGRPDRAAAAVGAADVRVVLVRVDGDVRIAHQELG